ncbi:ArsR/SmtB family transcription factor [Arthrobacter sp. KK5.5]|uniref:ArsR/SmtB family transcription factor n=1 Tax=Arthrobacter sp. KK5.5 TaxID=3373084 RepID=UPI003EE737CD
MHITLTSGDLTKIRFEASPMWETVTSLRALQVGTPIHRPWIESAKRSIAASMDPRKGAHLRLLSTVVRPRGFMADGLTPTPRHQDSFEEMPAAVAVTALRAVGGHRRPPGADLAERHRGGVPLAAPQCDPDSDRAGDRPGVRQVVPPDPGQGLILVPNAFIWPNTRVLNARPVAQLPGLPRAQILAQLDVPMTTTQLACALDLAAGTVSGHLKNMAAGGLASSLRSGREVFYQRADIGEALIARV